MVGSAVLTYIHPALGSLLGQHYVLDLGQAVGSYIHPTLGSLLGYLASIGPAGADSGSGPGATIGIAGLIGTVDTSRPFRRCPQAAVVSRFSHQAEDGRRSASVRARPARAAQVSEKEPCVARLAAVQRGAWRVDCAAAPRCSAAQYYLTCRAAER